jgi:hypothetical protein
MLVPPGNCGRYPSNEIAAPANQSTPHYWQLSKAHTGPRFAHRFLIPFVYDYIRKLCRQQTEVIQIHDNENVLTIRQGEARHRKYKRLKLGAGQACDRSSD